MAGVYKTPGVYIVEKSAFPNSVVEVATAVPAFIGYTEKADNKGESLINKPWRLTSLAEFQAYFGAAPLDKFAIGDVPAGTDQQPAPPAAFTIKGTGHTLSRPNDKADTNRYYLYRSIQLFFQNGGGACYIVSVGTYKDVPAIEKAALEGGLGLLLKEQEPTMVLIPDTMALERSVAINLQVNVLEHCASKMKNRFAILDIYDGFKDVAGGDPVKLFRNDLGINFLDYGAAYYPWLNTTIVDTTDLGFRNFTELAKLADVLLAGHGGKDKAPPELQEIIEKVRAITPEQLKKEDEEEGDAPAGDSKELGPKDLHKILFSLSPVYGNVLAAVARKLNLLPPSSAMAGVYTMVDNSRGVWKAPANVSLAAVVSPAVNISHDEQEGLNVSTTGKSINAIRSFIGEGVLVWGARTLDGNSLDWRYINVRRTMIMIEESLRLATKAYVFEPNVSGTWVTIKGMANNFLTSVWKRGGLAGASPEDAFSVSVGLGETMTSEDILEGILRVTILVAVSRPAEFIEITFQQQMQKS
jgi:phage tail sheath protein FI